VATVFKVSENRLQLVEHSRNDFQVPGIGSFTFPMRKSNGKFVIGIEQELANRKVSNDDPFSGI
jgi:hypothetical protein